MATKNEVVSPSALVCHPNELSALHSKALEATANAVVITDNTGTVVWVNFAFQQLTGYTRKEVVGQSTNLLKSGQTPQKVYDELWRTIVAGRVWRGELINKRRDGSLYSEEMTITPVMDGGGETTHYIAFKQDITERKNAEERTRWAEDSRRILSHMVELMQSCFTLEEAAKVTASSAHKLFPHFSGGVFLIGSSRNVLESKACWGRISSMEREFNTDNCWALRRGHINFSDRDDLAVRCEHLGTEFHVPSLCIPLIAQGETLGVVCLLAEVSDSVSTPDVNSDSIMQLAVSIAEQAAPSLANIKLRERLRSEAVRDSLTDLFNRRYLDEYLRREVSNAIRKERPLGVIMLDVDQFKRYNDMFGHDAGDAVLKSLAGHLMKFVRSGDLACRYGGEEFTLIFPDCLLNDTCRRAEELRASFQQLSIKHGDVVLEKVTLSLGVSAYPEHGKTPSELLVAADAALLRAKVGGRDRVLVGLLGA